MKRRTSLLLSICLLCVCLVGCGGSPQASDPPPSSPSMISAEPDVSDTAPSASPAQISDSPVAPTPAGSDPSAHPSESSVSPSVSASNSPSVSPKDPSQPPVSPPVAPSPSPAPGTPAEEGVTVRITGSATFGEILAAYTVSYQEGDTAISALRRACEENGISLDASSGKTAYVRGISDLYEFDEGAGSGWTYSVNSTYMTKGPGAVQMAPGDTLHFHYTLDYGRDVSTS